MKRLVVKYRREANKDLLDIAAYVIGRSQDLKTARAYVKRLRTRCQRIGDMPLGGVAREDLGAGVRIVVFERRYVILYSVVEDTVWITNIFSGGRDYETLFGRRGNGLPDEPA
jgi:toxin ParE1/3/4